MLLFFWYRQNQCLELHSKSMNFYLKQPHLFHFYHHALGGLAWPFLLVAAKDGLKGISFDQF